MSTNDVKQKKVALRRCVATNQMMPKKELIRIVKTPSGEIKIDLSGKENGRGAYIRPTIEAFEKVKKNKGLERNLKSKIDDNTYAEIEKEIKEG